MCEGLRPGRTWHGKRAYFHCLNLPRLNPFLALRLRDIGDVGSPDGAECTAEQTARALTRGGQKVQA